MPSYSKATQTRKPKKKGARISGICQSCAYIFHYKVDMPHEGCSGEHKPIVFHKRKTNKQMYEAALDYFCRLITVWRDGVVCVIGSSNNITCSEESHWGHVIPQGRSAYLVYNLSNSFRQCSTHNQAHRFVQAPYYDWYRSAWGAEAYSKLIATWEAKNDGLNEAQLKELLLKYVALYDSRYQYGSASVEEKVRAGFYGDIIQEAMKG